VRRSTFLHYFVLVYVALSTSAAFSQNSQSYLNDVGSPVYGVTIPVENGFIDVSNGNLHLEFPLATHPQRGALSLNEKLVYDSRIWMFSSFGTHGSYHWWPNNVPGSADTAAGWRFVTGAEVGAISYTTALRNRRQCQSSDGVEGVRYYDTTYANTYTWVDPSGASHTFDAPWLTQVSDCDDLSPNPQSASGWAADGSGYSISFSGDTLDPPTSITIKDSNGTQVYPQVVDRYGNYWSFDSNGNLVDDTGRTPVIVTQNGNTTYYDVLAPNGTINNNGLRVRYTVTTAPITVSTAFQPYSQSDIYPWLSSTDGVYLYPVQSILLPDGVSQYIFSYDTNGEVSNVTLPTGGVITYGYTDFVDSASTENMWLSSRTVGSNPSTTFTPSVVTACANYSTGCVEQVNVHKPSGDETVYQLTLNNGAWNTGVTSYTGAAATGTPLVQTSNTYNFSTACNPAVCNGSEYITKSLESTLLLATGIESYTQPLYESPATGQLTALKEWDYIPQASAPASGNAPATTPTRETDYTYTGFDVQQVTVLDNNGVQAGQTTYGYTTNATATSGVAQHGAQNAGGPYLQSVSHWLNTGSPSVATYTMDDTGEVIGTQDPDQHPATTISYQCANSLPYTVTNALSQVITYGYDCNSGAIRSVQNPNDAAATPVRSGATYSYEATAGRIQSVTFPDTGSTTYAYPSVTEVDTTITASPDPTITSANIVDSYGRAYQHVLNGDSSETSYDVNGRVSCVTNPHAILSSSTASTCVTSYDGLDRPLLQLQPDGTSTLQWSYSANTTTSTDESGDQMQRTSDAFGHLTSVSEILSGGSSLTSNYIHDGLGNLKQISQLGNGSTDVPRVRTFTYDSLARLLCESHPEGSTAQCPLTATSAYTPGTLGYGYDPNGNVTSKTDARAITTTYSYDFLNRLTSKTYSDGTTGAYFTYDQTGDWGAGSCSGGSTSGFSQCNTIGRLTWSNTGDQATQSMYGYDAMGRLTLKSTCFATLCGNDRIDQYFTYDLAGNPTSYDHGTDVARGSYFGGHGLTYDAAGQLQLVTAYQDSSSSASLFAATSYSPVGLLTSTLGNGLNEARSYDVRLRQLSYSVNNPNAPVSSAPPTGYADNVYNEANQTNVVAQNDTLSVRGWAASPGAGCPVASVEVDFDSTPIGSAMLGVSRPDVQAAFGGNSQFANCGYTFTGSIGDVAAGQYAVNVYGIDASGHRGALWGNWPITVTQNAPPFGNFEGATNPINGSNNFVSGGLITVGGWAVDSQVQSPVGAAKILVDNQPIGYATLGISRGDVAAYFNNSGYANSGFNFTGGIGDLSPGAHTVTAAVYDSGGQHVILNSYQINVSADTTAAYGSIDSVGYGSGWSTTIPSGGTLTAAGWAGQPYLSSCGPVTRIELWLGQTMIGLAQPGVVSRGDVAAAFSNPNCVNSGWSFSGPVGGVSPGAYQLVARMYDQSGGSVSLQSGTALTVSGQMPPSSVTTTLPTQYAWSLGYEPNSNVGYSADSVNGNWAYLYDNLNRLLAAGSTGNNGLAWQYDSFGNMLSQTVTGGTGTSKQFSYAANNQPTNMVFDAAGNQTVGLGNIGPWGQVYGYDAESRLKSADGVSYAYDAEGNRVMKLTNGQPTSYYLYDAGGRVVTEFDANFNPVRREVYAGDRHLATYQGVGALFTNSANQALAPMTYPLIDWLGTERARADSSGALCQTTASQPFGDNAQTNGTCFPTPALFTGLDRDPESGLDHAMARQYSSMMGRWMSPDPYDGSMDIGNPQSFNRYGYVNNRPTIFTDPSGLQQGTNGDGVAPTPSCGWFCTAVNDLGSLLSHLSFGGRPTMRQTNLPRPDANTGYYHTTPVTLGNDGIYTMSASVGQPLGLTNTIPLYLPAPSAIDLSAILSSAAKAIPIAAASAQLLTMQGDNSGCMPSAGTQCYETHSGHDHNGWDPHSHIWTMNQAPGRCIWNRGAGTSGATQFPPAGMEPCMAYPTWIQQQIP
jgi:RHS repeat-associated protein